MLSWLGVINHVWSKVLDPGLLWAKIGRLNNLNWFERAEKTNFRVQNYVNGGCRDVDGEFSIRKISPIDGSHLYEFKSGTAREVDEAVKCSRRAFSDGVWHKQSVHQRKQVMQNFRELIEKNAEELALLDCMDVGKPIAHALHSDIPMVLSLLDSYIGNMDKLFSPSGIDGSNFAYRMRKPIGVVGGIIGWNYPLVMAVLKFGPALAMGNSLVLKPSEMSPLSASKLGVLAEEAGIPRGVFNVVNGVGSIVGHRLAHHPDVDLISFTGGSDAGKKMLIAAGQSNMKRLILECGGKSPFIVFEDCPEDLDFIASIIVDMAFRNQGELCVSGSRLLVQSSIKDQLISKVVERAALLIPGHPLDPKSIFGPLVSESHMTKVLGFIESGKKQGAELILGGYRLGSDSGDINPEGYYIAPTIFDHVHPDSTIAQEEIFGPVLSIITFDSEHDAISIANNSRYGLAAYAATTSIARSQRLAREISCGCIQIFASSSFSEGRVEIGAEPQRQSGLGSDVGLDGLLCYSLYGTVNILW